MTHNYKLSVVIPVFDEAQSLPLLGERLLPVLEQFAPAEVIFVDDGSRDGSDQVLAQLQQAHPQVFKVIQLRRNCGKSTALQVGFEAARGELVAMMDADLQDAPEELPNLIAHLRENGLDVVTGWKAKRRDPWNKLFFSRIYNYILRKFFNLHVHDFNCGIKVMERRCLAGLRLFGQLHRFILVFLAHQGCKVGEAPVVHHARRFGRSKYGALRVYEGLMDFLAVLFLTQFSHSPLYLFGFCGLLCILFAVLFGGFFIFLHLLSLVSDFPQGSLVQHPIWILSPITGLIGVVFIFLGLLAEANYYLSQPMDAGRLVQRRLGFNPPGDES